MKSSKIEKMFDFNPNLDEAKTLSPLTYYQPFQSSFDPEFTTTTTSDKCPVGPETATKSPGERWLRTPEDFEGGANRRKESENLRKFAFDSDCCGPGAVAPKPAFSGPGRFAFERKPEAEKRSFSAWPGRGSDFGARRGFSSGFGPRPSGAAKGCCGTEPPSGSSGLGGFDGSSFGFGGPGRVDPVQAGQKPGVSRSVFHPLILSPDGKGPCQGFYKAGNNRPMICNFCKNNKEVPDIYLNHYLHDPETKVLTCPVLRKHVCEICGGTGDRAHTLQYCPVNRERGLQAKVPVLLKTRTITNSTGKIHRY